MTISSTQTRISYNGNGATTEFAFPYLFLAASDLEVRLVAADGAVTLLTLNTNYTVTGVGDDNGGEVTLNVAPASGQRLVINRVMDLVQEIDYITGDPFPAQTHERGLDRLTMMVQQHEERLDRTLQLPITSEANAALIDPEAVEVVAGIAGDVTAVALIDDDVSAVADIDANVTTVAGIAGNVTTVAGISGNVTAVAGNNANVTTVATNIANVNAVGTNISNVNAVAGNATNINAVNANSTNINTVAGISGDVTTVAGIAGDVQAVENIASNVTAVAGNATNINTVAGISANVTTVANNSANVTTVAGISANVTTVAGISANVTTVAGNSANVTTVAGISADVTSVAGVASDIPTVAANVADITNFADVYQGPKAADPTARNDSSALQTGDLYFNTVADEMRVYTGTAWKATGSAVNGTTKRQTFTATAAQTTFSITGGYDAGFIDVYLNGVKLVNGVDVTVSSGTDVVLASGAALNDVVDVIAYGAFVLANHYTIAEADAEFLRKAGEDGVWVSGGNVGIGTSSPADRLTVATTAGTFGVKPLGGSSVELNSNSAIKLKASANDCILDGANNNIFQIAGVDRMRIASDGSQSSVIPGGTTLYPEFKCRAWVNFNGGTAAIRASGNVSSITKHQTGDYTLNLTTAMPDTNYALGYLCKPTSDQSAETVGRTVNIKHNVSPTTTAVRVVTVTTANGREDWETVTVNIFR